MKPDVGYGSPQIFTMYVRDNVCNRGGEGGRLVGMYNACCMRGVYGGAVVWCMVDMCLKGYVLVEVLDVWAWCVICVWCVVCGQVICSMGTLNSTMWLLPCSITTEPGAVLYGHVLPTGFVSKSFLVPWGLPFQAL